MRTVEVRILNALSSEQLSQAVSEEAQSPAERAAGGVAVSKIFEEPQSPIESFEIVCCSI